MSRVLRALALLVVSASAASAQVQNRQFSVVTRLGSITPDRASSLNAGPLIGLDTESALNQDFGIGTNLDVTRTNTPHEELLQQLRYGQVIPVEQVVADVEAVTADDVRGVASGRMRGEAMHLAVIGPYSDDDARELEGLIGEGL